MRVLLGLLLVGIFGCNAFVPSNPTKSVLKQAQVASSAASSKSALEAYFSSNVSDQDRMASGGRYTNWNRGYGGYGGYGGYDYGYNRYNNGGYYGEGPMRWNNNRYYNQPVGYNNRYGYGGNRYYNNGYGGGYNNYYQPVNYRNNNRYNRDPLTRDSYYGGNRYYNNYNNGYGNGGMYYNNNGYGNGGGGMYYNNGGGYGNNGFNHGQRYGGGYGNWNNQPVNYYNNNNRYYGGGGNNGYYGGGPQRYGPWSPQQRFYDAKRGFNQDRYFFMNSQPVDPIYDDYGGGYDQPRVNTPWESMGRRRSLWN